MEITWEQITEWIKRFLLGLADRVQEEMPYYEAMAQMRGMEATILGIFGESLRRNFYEVCFNYMPFELIPYAVPHQWYNGVSGPLALFNHKDNRVTKQIVGIKTLWDSLPKDRPTDVGKLIWKYFYILSSIDGYVRRLKPNQRISISWFPFEGDKDGQMMSNFSVKDLTLPDDPSRMNFHGQNTSQWLFAGCLLSSEDGSLSIHT